MLATLCSAVMIAFQTASKVIRDTMFFEAFDVTALPMMVVGTAVASIAFAIPAGRLMRVISPARLIPPGFVLSTILLMVEWFFARQAPRVAAIAVYLHFGALGAVLISGFWSLINERFDPHSAKLYVSRIAGGATLGGLAGGIIAERMSGVLEAAAGLPVLAAFHAICAVITFYLVAGHKRAAGEMPPDEDKTAVEANVRPGNATRSDTGDGESMLTGLAIVGRVPYLRNLAGLVLLTTTASGLLDYLFKAATVAHYVEKADRQRFFAIFYTASALATFLIQALFGSRLLRRFGIAVTMGTLPVITGLGAIANLLFPGIWTSTVLRGGEMSLRSSLFRAGYEQHYAPIPRSEKRPAKSVIDVVVDRTGDAVGGGIIQFFLMFVAADSPRIITLLAGATVLLYVVAIVIVRRLSSGYLQAVEKSLLERAIDLEAVDLHTRLHVSGSVASLYDSLRNAKLEAQHKTLAMQSLQQIQPVPSSEAKGGAHLGSEHHATQDHIVAICADLRSRDKIRVKRALKAFASVDRPPIAVAIPLLAWDAVAPMVVETLRLHVDRHCGALLDTLFDEEEEFTIRRRVPRVLAAATSQRAVDGLVTLLLSKRFELRLPRRDRLGADPQPLTQRDHRRRPHLRRDSRCRRQRRPGHRLAHHCRSHAG